MCLVLLLIVGTLSNNNLHNVILQYNTMICVIPYILYCKLSQVYLRLKYEMETKFVFLI